MSEAKFQCGGSEVRIICAATSSCGLVNQSHTRINNLLVSFDSEVRKGRRRERMRTSESEHCRIDASPQPLGRNTAAFQAVSLVGWHVCPDRANLTPRFELGPSSMC